MYSIPERSRDSGFYVWTKPDNVGLDNCHLVIILA